MNSKLTKRTLQEKTEESSISTNGHSESAKSKVAKSKVIRNGRGNTSAGIPLDLSGKSASKSVSVKPAPPWPESDAINREIIDNANDIIYTHDLQGNFTYANRAVTTLLGYTREEALRLNIRDVVVPEDLQHATGAVAAKLAGKKGDVTYQLRVMSKDHHIVTLELSTRLIQRDKVPVLVHGIGRDISERLRVETALRESEAKFRGVAESAPCAIAIYQGTKLCYVNPTAQRLTGYSEQELLNLEHFWDIVAPEFQELVKSRAAARLRGEAVPGHYEVKIRRKSGEERWMDFTGSSIQYDSKTAVVFMMFDVTKRRLAEQALIESEQLFRAVIENSSDIITILDQKGIIQYESASVKSMLGYDPAELIGKSAFDFVHPDSQSHAREGFSRGLVNARAYPPVELQVRHQDGYWKAFEAVSGHLQHGADAGVVVSLRDISDRRKQEAEIRASEERFRQLFERNLAGVFVSTLEGSMVDCNDSFAQMYGYESREQVLTQRAHDFYPEAGVRNEFMVKLRKARAFTNLESLARRRDGSHMWVLENIALLKPNGQGQELIQGTVFDITERKHAEQALIESESKFRAVADTAASAIYIHNGKNFLYLNRSCEEMSGYSLNELLKMDPMEIVHPDDRQLVGQRSVQRLHGQPVQGRYEYRFLAKSGSVRWVDFSASTIKFGGQDAILGTAFDITERKHAETMQAALYRISERANAIEDLGEFFAAIHHIVGEMVEARNFYIALWDSETNTITYPYYADETRQAPRSPIAAGRGLTEHVVRTGQPLLATPEICQQLVASGEVASLPDCVDWVGVPLKSGGHAFGVLAVQTYNHAVRFGERELETLSFVSQHLSSAILQKRNEKALRASELHNRLLVQSAVYGIYRSNAEGRFLEVNPALVNMLGYASAEQVLALDMRNDVYADAEERARLIETHSGGRVENVEAVWKRKDGKIITVRLSGRAIFNEQGRIEAFEMITEDITERRALEEQLRQSQKMEAVGRLAGGVAHDFNNLLTVIKGYSELILEEIKESDPFRSELDEIKKAADRAASLTRQLLAFSRQQVMAPKVLDLNSVIGNMDKLLTRLLGEDIILNAVLEAGLGRVKADPGQIEQVVMNLAVNARDAMVRGGKLTIETANVQLDENYVREHVGSRAGPYVMMAVADTGMGMTEEIRQRIFEPFFTTKEVGKGTGLGLSTVYGIVKQSDGYIWAGSEVGVGTRFEIYLPRVNAPADISVVRPLSDASYRGDETVLLVEDEDGVRALIRQVLHKHGYTVLEARHGGEALLHCDRHNGPIELLLTDVVLEQMGGPELAKRLSVIRPDMKVLYISGYTDDAILHDGILSPGTAFLQKPFTTEALAKKIRQVLEGA